MTNSFETFEDAIFALTSACFSARQAINHGLQLHRNGFMHDSGCNTIPYKASIQEVKAGLQLNAANEEPTYSGFPAGFTYVTSGGLGFTVRGQRGAEWMVVVDHPSSEFGEDSSLRRALKEYGFESNNVEPEEVPF